MYNILLTNNYNLVITDVLVRLKMNRIQSKKCEPLKYNCGLNSMIYCMRKIKLNVYGL